MRGRDFREIAILGYDVETMLYRGGCDQSVGQPDRAMNSGCLAVCNEPCPCIHHCLADRYRVGGPGQGEGVGAASTDGVVIRF